MKTRDILFLAFFFWLCAAAGQAAKSRQTFAIVPKLLDNPVFNYARVGAEKQAEAFGDVRIIWRAPQEADAAKQVEIIEGLVNMRVDGIAVSCNEPNALKPAIDRAIEAGVPVITFDSDSPESKRLTYHGINDVECGRILGNELARLLNQGGDVAMMTGMRGAFNLEERMRGVRAALEDHPRIKIVQTVACDDDIAKAVSLLEGIHRARPALGGWIFVGGWPLFARGALDPLEGSPTRVVSWDALPPQWEYLAKGQVSVLLGQRVFHWGAESVKLLRAAAAGKKLPRHSYAGVDLVTPASLPRYREMWASWEDPDKPLRNYPPLRPAREKDKANGPR